MAGICPNDGRHIFAQMIAETWTILGCLLEGFSGPHASNQPKAFSLRKLCKNKFLCSVVFVFFAMHGFMCSPSRLLQRIGRSTGCATMAGDYGVFDETACRPTPPTNPAATRGKGGWVVLPRVAEGRPGTANF